MNANGWQKRQAQRVAHEKKVVTRPRCSMCRHPDHELYEAKIVRVKLRKLKPHG